MGVSTQQQVQQTAADTGRGGGGLLAHPGLLLILLGFLILATLHSLIVPITQGEDELAHYRYMSFIAQTGRLPINEAERDQAWYRADWPPLYHLLVGWTVNSIDTTRPPLKDVGESPRRRLVGQIFYPRLLIYTEDVNWPWQDGILAWHIGRFISILFATGALVFAYVTTLELCRGAAKRSPQLPGFLAPRPVALATTALLAFTPRFLFTSAMLGDDSLFILLSAIFIWLLLGSVGGDDRWWLYAVMGILLGLSIATKYSTGLLPLVVVPAVLGRARPAGWPWTQALGRIGLTWLFTVIGASWWFGWIGYHFNTVREDGLVFGLLRPLLASGPDVSMRRIFALFTDAQFTGQERPDAIEAGSFWDWLVYLFQTFWGVPVLEQDPLYPWGYLLLLLFCLVALIGLWRLWQTADGLTRATLGLLGLIVLLLLPFPILRFFLTHNILETGQGRHILYPAAQAIPILLVFGWAQMVPRFFPRTPRLGLYLPAALLLVWSLFQLVYMTFTYPDPLPVQTTTFDPQSVPRPLRRNFGDDIQLLGYDLETHPDQPVLNLTLYWRSLQPVEQNYRTQVQLVDPAGQAHFTWLNHPLNGRYPTRAWDAGDVIRDKLPLPLAGVPPNAYTLQLDLLHEAQDISLTGEPLPLDQIELRTPYPIPDPARLDDIDYRLWVDDKPARYRQTVPLSWTASDPLEAAETGQTPGWSLVGPDGVARLPAAVSDATAIFIVGADWPSGDYYLRLDRNGREPAQTEPLLAVSNDLRLFDLSPLPEGFIPVEATFADFRGTPQVKLLGYRLPRRRVEPGEGLPLTLYWQSLAPVLGDYIVFDVLLDEKQQAYGGYDRLPREYYSTILWAENEVVVDGFAVPVSPEAHPGIYDLHIGLYSLTGGGPVSLPLLEEGHLTEVTSVVIGPVKVGGPPPGLTVSNPVPQVQINQTFGNQITLLGYDLIDGQGRPVQDWTPQTKNLKLILYWQAETRPNADYTRFFHLRDLAGNNVAQKDRPPANGRYPTSLWDGTEIIVDEVSLSLADLPPGQYIPVVGLYDFTTGARLPTGDTATELPLERVTVP